MGHKSIRVGAIRDFGGFSVIRCARTHTPPLEWQTRPRNMFGCSPNFWGVVAYTAKPHLVQLRRRFGGALL